MKVLLETSIISSVAGRLRHCEVELRCACRCGPRPGVGEGDKVSDSTMMRQVETWVCGCVTHRLALHDWRSVQISKILINSRYTPGDSSCQRGRPHLHTRWL